MCQWRAISRVIPLTVPSHQAKGGNGADRNGSIAAFPDRRPSDAPINNRDVPSHSSSPRVSRGVHFRMTRPRHVAWRARHDRDVAGPKLSLSLFRAPTACTECWSPAIVSCPRTSSYVVSLIIGGHPVHACRYAGITRRAICNWHGLCGVSKV